MVVYPGYCRAVAMVLWVTVSGMTGCSSCHGDALVGDTSEWNEADYRSEPEDVDAADEAAHETSWCGNGVVEQAEECDQEDPGTCTTACGTDGAMPCTDCRWGECRIPDETCNGIDDDCNGVIDDVAGEPGCGDGCCNTSETFCTCPADCGLPSPPTVPYLLVPENGARIKPPRPSFSWLPSSGECGTPLYEIQVDDQCTTPGFGACTFPDPELASAGIDAISLVAPSDLPIRTSPPVGKRYYWRIRACYGISCSGWSPVRYLDAGAAYLDFNGDGFSDLAVGAPGQNAGRFWEGNVFVYNGGPAGLEDEPSLVIDNPDEDQMEAHFGRRVEDALDLNADGFCDLVVGAPLQKDGMRRLVGAAFVYFGTAAGLPAMPSIRLDNPESQVDTGFGGVLDSLHDVNADGYADLAVGAEWYDVGHGSEGAVFVYQGGPAGVPDVPDETVLGPAHQPDSAFGSSLGAADANLDGYSDLSVGAVLYDGAREDEGAVYVFYGSALGIMDSGSEPSFIENPDGTAGGRFGFWTSFGDLGDDFFPDLAVSATLQGAGLDGEVFLFEGGLSGVGGPPFLTHESDDPALDDFAMFGNALSVCDLNLDGYNDLVIGSPAYRSDFTAENSEGAVFLFNGGPAGPSGPPVMLANPFSSEDSRNFGFSVSCAGDLNGDGYGDLAVGDPLYSGDTAFCCDGAVYVYYGSNAGISSTPFVALSNVASSDGQGEMGLSIASK
jgi:hypothetical protein